VNYRGVTAERMTDAWWRGGSAFRYFILGIPEVVETLHGEYLKRRGGLPGKVNWENRSVVVRWCWCDRSNTLTYPCPNFPNTRPQANSVLPGDPPIDEQLPPVPGPPVPNEGGSSKQIMLALIQMLRAEENKERARELEEHERSVTQMLAMIKPI
jgi:hypothetical protein